MISSVHLTHRLAAVRDISQLTADDIASPSPNSMMGLHGREKSKVQSVRLRQGDLARSSAQRHLDDKNYLPRVLKESACSC